MGELEQANQSLYQADVLLSLLHPTSHIIIITHDSDNLSLYVPSYSGGTLLGYSLIKVEAVKIKKKVHCIYSLSSTSQLCSKTWRHNFSFLAVQ